MGSMRQLGLALLLCLGLDVSNPLQPRLLQQLVVPGRIRRLALDPTFLYASDASSIIDVIMMMP